MYANLDQFKPAPYIRDFVQPLRPGVGNTTLYKWLNHFMRETMKKGIDGNKLNAFKEFNSFDENDFSYYQDLPCSKLDSWKEFHSLLSNKIFEDEDILFRGQGNADWGLVPLLNRINNEPEENIIKDTLSRFRATLFEMGSNDAVSLMTTNYGRLGATMAYPLQYWIGHQILSLLFFLH